MLLHGTSATAAGTSGSCSGGSASGSGTAGSSTNGTGGIVEPWVVQLVAPGVMVPRWDPRCAVIRRMNRLRDHRFLSRLNRSHRRFS